MPVAGIPTNRLRVSTGTDPDYKLLRSTLARCRRQLTNVEKHRKRAKSLSEDHPWRRRLNDQRTSLEGELREVRDRLLQLASGVDSKHPKTQSPQNSGRLALTDLQNLKGCEEVISILLEDCAFFVKIPETRLYGWLKCMDTAISQVETEIDQTTSKQLELPRHTICRFQNVNTQRIWSPSVPWGIILTSRSPGPTRNVILQFDENSLRITGPRSTVLKLLKGMRHGVWSFYTSAQDSGKSITIEDGSHGRDSIKLAAFRFHSERPRTTAYTSAGSHPKEKIRILRFRCYFGESYWNFTKGQAKTSET